MRVLVVEDEPKMQAVLARGLREEGYAVDCTADGPGALEQGIREVYDAIVLDVMLPGLDGFEVLRRLREGQVWVPVLLLTARDSVDDRVRGLDSGADDYLVKPFAFSELLSRLRALVRRGQPPRPTVLQCGPLTLDPAARTVTVDGSLVALSGREFAVLELLLRRHGDVVSRTQIVEHVWDEQFDCESNIVDVYVKCLRDKIDRRFDVRLIRTVRGSGYRLTAAGP